MTLKNLTDLFQAQIQDLHSAEHQLLESLPKMAASAHSESLRSAFTKHLDETRGHIQRLERISLELNFKPNRKPCAAMKGLVEEGAGAIDTSAPSAIHDVNLIAAAQRAEHYEMSGYGTARELAQVLGYTKAAEWLQDSLEEERAADLKLTEVCRALLNQAPLDDTDTANAPKNVKRDENRDPITGEHGAHIVGTGVGAAAGGVVAGAGAGAAIGMVAGPVGAMVGAAVGATAGAVVGGLAGKAVAEKVNPTVEHDYWRSQFRSRQYVGQSDSYDIYAPAFQYGWESRAKFKDKQFSDVAQELESGWPKVRGSSNLTWQQAKNATRDGWDRTPNSTL